MTILNMVYLKSESKPIIDITNVTTTSQSINGWNGGFGGVFSIDGTKFFSTNRSSGVVWKVLSTPFDLSTITTSYSENPGGDIHQVYLSSDGRKAAFASYNGYVGIWTLSTPFDFSTRTNYKTYSITGYKPAGVTFKPDGTIMYIVNYGGGYGTKSLIKQYSLGTAWDITTATGGNYIETDTTTRGVSISSNGEYIIFTENNFTLQQYSLGTAWDITTATSYKTKTVSSFVSTFLGDDSGYVDGEQSIVRINLFR